MRITSSNSINSSSLPEIISIGFDLEEVRRFTKYINHLPLWEGLLHDVFTEEERQCNNRHSFPACCYTLCFCFKEATFKALGKSWMHGEVDWKEIELLFETKDEFAIINIRLSGDALNLYQGLGAVNIDCKVACDHTIASCNVIITK